MSRLSIFIVTLLLFVCAEHTFAVTAYPFPITYVADNGKSFILRLKGNEQFKFAYTESGHCVVKDTMDCWRYVMIENESQSLSDFTLDESDDFQVQAKINSIPKGLIPILDNHQNKLLSIKSKTDETDASDLSANSKTAITGERKALIILMQFPDQKMRHDSGDFNDLFNKIGYTENESTGSVLDYFTEVSEGQLLLSSEVLGPFTSSRNMAWYGKNTSAGGTDANPYSLFQEALEFAKKKVDLHDFDCDKNGLIDNIHIIYAGYGEEAGASSNAIWAHECAFQPFNVYDDLKIDRYSCSPELRNNSGNTITTIGPACHEICHALGTMDFYDTDYSNNGEYCGTGEWDIMASGSWNNHGNTPAWPNPYTRCYDFGWAEPLHLTEESDYIFDNSLTHTIYRIETPMEGDYFLLEYRDHHSFSSREPGEGLMIFHIGPDIAKSGRSNTINATFPQQCYPVCASSSTAVPNKNPSSYGNINTRGCAFKANNNASSFGSNTVPSASTIDGKPCQFLVDDIHIADDGTLIFHYNPINDPAIETDNNIWKEDFEKKSNYSFWTQENVKGYADWKYEFLFNESDEVNACYALKVDGDKMNPKYITTRLLSPEISFTHGVHNVNELKLSFDIFNSFSENCEWIVSIYDRDSLIVCDTISIPKNDKEWNSFEISTNLTNDTSDKVSSYKVEFISKIPCDTKSTLYLDNVNLNYVENPQASVIFNEIKGYDGVGIYNVNGIKLFEDVSSYGNLPSGIYLIRKESETKKIFIHS